MRTTTTTTTPPRPGARAGSAAQLLRLAGAVAATRSLLRASGGDPRGHSGGPAPGRAVAAVVAGFLAGSVPVANIAARRIAGQDLRRVGSGTVSGTGLFEVAGFPTLAMAGIVEVAKGAVGPLLAGGDEPVAAAVAAGAAVTGHDWSPWLGGAGGRGISPAMGALLPEAPAGTAVLLAGLALGRLAGETAVGSLLADLALLPVVRRVHGREASWAAGAVVLPMVLKRLAGNHAPAERTVATYLSRLVFDRDPGAIAVADAGPTAVSSSRRVGGWRARR